MARSPFTFFRRSIKADQLVQLDGLEDTWSSQRTSQVIDFERCSLCQAHHEPGLRALLSFAYHVPVPVDELLSRLKEIEDLIRVPGLIGHSASARSLAMSIARQAPTEGVANLAAQLTAAVDALEEHELPLSASNIDLSKTLWRLRLALEREKKGD